MRGLISQISFKLGKIIGKRVDQKALTGEHALAGREKLLLSLFTTYKFQAVGVVFQEQY